MTKRKSIHGQTGLTIGEILEQISDVDDDTIVYFDFDTTLDCKDTPIQTVGSYRGFYDDLGIKYDTEFNGKSTVGYFRDVLEKSIGMEFMGWKGGKFEMHEGTTCWAVPKRKYTGPLIIGAEEIGSNLILCTDYYDVIADV